MTNATADLLIQREREMDRADLALDKAWPERKGREYTNEMTAVARELEQIARELDESGGSDIERSRTYRFLAGVYSDLEPSLGKAMLTTSVKAFQKAEALLAGIEEPLETAKLNFNFANTLRQIDKNDGQLLRDVEHRYEVALELFRKHAPQLAPQVQQALESVRVLVNLAPLANVVERSRSDMEDLEQQLAAGGNVAEIAAKMKQVQERDGGPAGLFAALQGITQGLPDSHKQGDKNNELIRQMDQLRSLIQSEGPATDTDESRILQMLRDRLAREAEAGRVTTDRAHTLSSLIDNFGKTLGSGNDDLQTLMNQRQEMKAKIEGHFANLHYLSHGLERPPDGTRAAQLVELCWAVRLFLAEEVSRSGKSDGESKSGFDLNVRAADVDKRIYQAGNDDARAIVVDKEALRPFALEVRNFAARHHPLVAQPVWHGARMQVDTNALLFSGSAKVRQQISKICREIGLKLMSAPTGENIAGARWKQLQKANTTVFDLSVRGLASRAAVAYELGIALTLGKPVVVLAKENQDIPFDVDVEPILLSGTARDQSTISEAIDRSLVWAMPRPHANGIQATVEHILNRYPIPHTNTYVNQTLKQLQRLRNDPDPVAVGAALKTLVDFLDDDRPTLMHPVWPPVYPEPGKERLFHVMPFQPKWANAAAERVEAACNASGVEYIRGDRVNEPNVIRSIWEEINRATHILVDLTGFNANVALELGIAHSIGRRDLTVGQGNTVERLFPTIAKRRFYPYKSAQSSELDALVKKFVGVVT